MNSRHRKTLELVFDEPAKANIVWADIEALLIAVGCTMKEGAGSRVKFTIGDMTLAAHRPHPQKEAKRYLVRMVREFLNTNGILP